MEDCSPYTFDWSNGDSGSNISGLTTGSYDVMVTDAIGCTGVASVYVDTDTLPCQLDAIIMESQPISCEGINDGELYADVFGGDGPYSYYWSNGSIDQYNYGVAAGTYELTVTDANGCTVSSTYTLTEPSPIIISVQGTNETAPGAQDGNAYADAMGGTPPYSYYWTNGESGYSASGLAGGIYEVIVTDYNGCTMTESIEIATDIPPCDLTAGINEIMPITCFGGNDGELQAYGVGGTTPYIYTWSTTASTEWITGLSGGWYEVTVTDAEGCTATAGTALYDASELFVMTYANNTSTTSSDDGTATAIGYGGAEPYTFNWDNGEVSDTIIGLSTGIYSVTLTDANGCTASSEVYVGSDDPGCFGLQVSTYVTSNFGGYDISCYYSTDGAAGSTPSGGTSPL